MHSDKILKNTLAVLPGVISGLIMQSLGQKNYSCAVSQYPNKGGTGLLNPHSCKRVLNNPSRQFSKAPAVGGPGSADAIADAKRKTHFSSPGPPSGSADDAIASEATRRKILLVLC